MSYNFTGATVSSTYGRIVQVVLGSPNLYYDGFGNPLDLGSGTASVGPQGATGATGSQGTSMVFQDEWDDMMMYFYYDFVTYNGNAYICISTPTGSAPWISPDLDTTHWEQMMIGLSGSSGSSGTSGVSIIGATGGSGSSGTSGIDGSSGTSGTSGSSGSSGTSGSTGSSGTSGTNGANGSSGTSGENGSSGTSGENGSSGTSGANGSSGSSGSSGENGSSGSSGSSGENGSSGTSGENGSSGSSGTSGANGSSGSSGSSGESGSSGTSGANGSSGSSGSSGESGSSGTSGENGSSGSSGESGSSGTSGSSGESGSSGTSGVNGSSGTSGVNGSSGTSGSSGSSGINGATGSTGPQGISAGQIYYFNLSATASVNGYRDLSTTPLPNGGTYSIETMTGHEIGHLVETFITEPLGFSIIPAGVQRFHLHFLKGAVGHDIEAYVKIQLADSSGTPIGPTLSTGKNYIGWNDSVTTIETLVDLTLPTTGIDPTNRMIVNIYLDNKDSNSRTVQWHTEGTNDYSYAMTSVGVINGTSGSSGSSGTSGSSGSSGTSGSSGSSGTSGSSGSSGTSGLQGDKGGLQYILGDSAGGAPLTGKFTIYSSEGVIFDVRINVTDRLGVNNSGYFYQLLGSSGCIYITNNSNSIGRAIAVPFTNVTLVSGYYLFGLDFASAVEGNLIPNDICALTIVINGSSGSSGTSGSRGSSGRSGSSGSSGTSGSSGSSGTSGLLALTGTTNNGIITLDGSAPNGNVESNLTFDGSTLNVGGSIIVSASTTTDLVRITQTGTGNSFVVEDSTNPDLTSFVIDKSGNVGIGVPSNSTNSYRLYTFATSSIAIYAQSEGNHGIYGISQHPSYSGVVGVNSAGVGIFGISSNGLAIRGLGATIGVQGEVATDFSGAIGVYGLVYDIDGGSGIYIGGKFSAGSGAGTNYSIQLLDGTQDVNKVLVSQTSDGKANWSNTLTGLTSVSTTTLNATQSTISGSTSTDLVSITQIGTGNALVVKDSSNDTSNFVIDQNGNVVIGATATTYKLDVVGNTRIAGNIYGTNSNNTMVTDALIQAGLLFLSNNC